MGAISRRGIETVPSGTEWLDRLVGALRIGDNVVVRTDDLEDYKKLVVAFVRASADAGRKVVYLRFGNHPALLGEFSGAATVILDPSPGFDFFSKSVHRIVNRHGAGMFYVFDSLSSLVEEWATDELLANFFQVTCPHLFELDTVAWFTLGRERHDNNTVARIEHTTQVLVDMFAEGGQHYVHVLKAQKRFWPGMYVPHRLEGGNCVPTFQAAHIPADTARSPWETVFAKAAQWAENEPPPDAQEETDSLRHELARMLLGQDAGVLDLAGRFFDLKDFLDIKRRLIGTGRIGGKATGLLLARKILMGSNGGSELPEWLEDHDSFYIGSDVFFTFLVENNLFRTRLRAGVSASGTDADWDRTEQAFLRGELPGDIVHHLEEMLRYFEDAPIIVRSSSLLEDGFRNAFAGKYHSEFCPNQGTDAQRLEALVCAIKRVYASTLNPDALAYRKKRRLEDRDEQMGVLIQRVSGEPFGRWFFPMLAGVAFSRNLYAWNSRIDPEKGLIRLVFGLGTSAVDRVGGGYPRLVAISHPLLRPEIGVKIAKYSQREMDAIDLASNAVVAVPAQDILEQKGFPDLSLLVSIQRDEELYEPFYRNFSPGPDEKLVLTFHNFLKKTDFVGRMDAMLTRLEEAYGTPVDTEFTVSLQQGRPRINLLQCRPLWHPGDPAGEEMEIPAEGRLLETDKFMCAGLARDVRYVIYVDPEAYSQLRDPVLQKSLGRVIGRLNREVETRDSGGLLLAGPGRWGSNNPDLGVNVTYADIHHVSALVEIAMPGAEELPEVSYGTHFFLDIVEGGTLYLALFPGRREAPFFKEAPNQLLQDFPEMQEFEPLIKWIDLERIEPGRRIAVSISPRLGHAVAWFDRLRFD